jgi:hypothetical protein
MTNIREYISNCPVDRNLIAKITDNPLFVMGTRFAQKEALGLWSDREHFGNFHVMFGVAKESIGKIHFANNILPSNVIYYWGDYCDNKMVRAKCNYHIGASPFFYAHLLNYRKDVKREGTIFFLPRIDHRVFLNYNSKTFNQIQSLIDNAPKPVTVLSYLDCHAIWNKKLKNDIKILSYDVGDFMWQFKLNEVFLRHKYSYIPNICSDFFYSTIAGCEAIYYDALDIYNQKYHTDSLIPSYHKSKVTKTYLEFDNILKNLFGGNGITEEQIYLSGRMLSITKSECSEDLAVTMERLTASQQILRYDIDAADSHRRHFTTKHASKYRSQFNSKEDSEALRKKFIDEFKSIEKIDYIDDIMRFL